MFSSNSLYLNILDVALLKRGKTNIKTKNKECFVISCRISGSAVFSTDNDFFTVNRGDILYIPIGASYTQHTEGEEIIYIHIEFFGSYAKNFQHICSENPQQAYEYFTKIEKLWRKKDKNYKYFCTALLYELIAKTGVSLPCNFSDEKNIISAAMQYISEHFSDRDFSLETACGLCNISRVYFNRIFKKENGITPSHYINQLKINKAKFLLKNGNYTHNEISYLCGFNDTKYFYTVFKNITGITAGKYQKNINS